jgi:hypothetical protein
LIADFAEHECRGHRHRLNPEDLQSDHPSRESAIGARMLSGAIAIASKARLDLADDRHEA